MKNDLQLGKQISYTFRDDEKGGDTNDRLFLFAGASDFVERWTIESLAVSVRKDAARNGWPVYLAWTDKGLVLRVSGGDVVRLRAYVNAIASGVAKDRWSITIVESTQPGMPMPDISCAIPWGTVVQEPLTKKLLHKLPADCVIVSNIRDGRGASIYSGQIPHTLEDRESLWHRAKICGANNRLCRILWYRQDWPFAVANLGPFVTAR